MRFNNRKIALSSWEQCRLGYQRLATTWLTKTNAARTRLVVLRLEPCCNRRPWSEVSQKIQQVLSNKCAIQQALPVTSDSKTATTGRSTTKLQASTSMFADRLPPHHWVRRAWKGISNLLRKLPIKDCLLTLVFSFPQREALPRAILQNAMTFLADCISSYHTKKRVESRFGCPKWRASGVRERKLKPHHFLGQHGVEVYCLNETRRQPEPYCGGC